jgi:hypothetical protein
MAITFWLRRPILAAARLRLWVREQLRPEEPWLCSGTIDFCESNLSKGMKAVEFGSGRSTPWLAACVGHLLSIEHNEFWYKKVSEKLNAAGVNNVDYRFIPLNHPEQQAEQEIYSPVPAYIAVLDTLENGSVDFALIDGHYRTNCIKYIVPKLARGGYLAVDDVNIWPSIGHLPVPNGWRIVDDSSNGLKRCVIWQSSE